MTGDFLKRHLVHPVIKLLVGGVTPEKIALSLTLGLVIGVCPVLGLTTVLCAAAAILFRLNLPAIQLTNYLAYPLQFVFMIPFIRFGEHLFGAERLRFSVQQMLAMARADLSHAVATLWLAALQGLAAWLLVSPILVFILYALFLRLVFFLAQFRAPGVAPAGKP